MIRAGAIAVLLAGCAAPAAAHSGGTDAQGCHLERATGHRHCHGGRAARSRERFDTVLRAVGGAYPNCAAARAAGAAPVRRGDPGYSRKIDRDGDGIGCE